MGSNAQDRGKQSTVIRDNSLAYTIGSFHLDNIYFLDAIEGMKQLPDNSVDILIADPPYNASKGNELKWDNSVDLPGFGGKWNKIMVEWDDMDLYDYFKFSYKWLLEAKRVLKPTGSIWVHGTFHNIGIINFVMQILKIEIINEVVWYKRNSFPNLRGRRLTASHETIIWAHSGDGNREYFFDYEKSKHLACYGDRLKETGKQMRTVWDIPNNKERREIAYGKHPAQKPIKLLKRMLEISTKPGQILLAPFSGSGSECVAAKEIGLHFIGFENNKSYFDISIKRIENTQNLVFDRLDNPVDRIPFIQRTLFESRNIPKSIPPLIKWTGSKRSLAKLILQYVPEHKRYFEPFLGGGAMLYLLAGSGAIAGDIYCPLIELWNLVKTNPDKLLENYKKQWELLQVRLPEYYYEVRDRFNNDPNPFDLNFLDRTCVNGIIRFNSDGLFNNSFHLSRKGMNPETFSKVVLKWHERIQEVSFVCQDYEETLNEMGEGDFAYLDPPYIQNKQRYYDDIDFSRLFRVLSDLNNKKVKWALSLDGRRGERDYIVAIPNEIYKRKFSLPSGNSPVKKVLDGPVEMVYESLYLNY